MNSEHKVEAMENNFQNPNILRASSLIALIKSSTAVYHPQNSRTWPRIVDRSIVNREQHLGDEG